MRVFSEVTSIPAGGRWPSSAGGRSVPPFRWLLIENRGAHGSTNDLVVSIGGAVSNDTATTGYQFRVPAGCAVTRSAASDVAGVEEDASPLASELSILNVGAAAVAVYIELDDASEIKQRTLLLSP